MKDKTQEELEKEIVKEVMDKWKKGNITFIENAFKLLASKMYLATKQVMIKEFEKIIDDVQDWGGFQELKQKLKEIK